MPFACVRTVSGQIRHILHRDLKAAAYPDWPLSMHAGRHALSTHLREMGCPGWLVDVVLGHALYGQEAHSRFSALAPRHLARLLGPWLDNYENSLAF